MITNYVGSINFNFLGYLSVHRAKMSEDNHCGEILEEGITILEAMRYALELANKNNSELLFGIKSHFWISDTCRNVPTLVRSFSKSLGRYYMGIIGPTTSDQGLLTSIVHGAYDAAVVSHSATSQIFDKRDSYSNFFRTVPSDSRQVNALIDILMHFNWTYVSTVRSYGEYGSSGMEHLLEEFRLRGGCVARQKTLPSKAKAADFEKVINDLKSAPKAKVVVLFTTLGDVNRLLEAAEKLNCDKVTWLSSTTWKIPSVIRTAAAKGALTLSYKIPKHEKFKKHFMGLKLKNNTYSWFEEFWSKVFRCNTGKVTMKYDKNCTGTESLESSDFQMVEESVGSVLSATASVLCALRKSIIKRCPKMARSCIISTLTRTYNFERDVVKNLKNGTTYCPEFHHSVQFNQYGFYDRPLEVFNFDGKSYRKVGEWSYDLLYKTGSLRWTDKIIWRENSETKSFCSVPCKVAEVRLINDNGCCYSCKKCHHNSITVNNTCFSCSDLEIPDRSRTRCQQRPKINMLQAKVGSSVSIACSLLGAIANTIVAAVLIKHRQSRIVKATSIELTLFISMALYICFLAPIFFLMRPTKVTCGLQRFIVGISLTSCYTPLMLKVTRVYRIFNAAHTTTQRPLLVSRKSQIIICAVLIGLQLLLGIMWVLTEKPKITLKRLPDRNLVAILCQSSTFNVIFNLIPAFILMMICTVYAYKTRQFPTNFNEALSTFIAMYLSCFLWGIFITLIIFLEMDKGKVLLLGFVIANFTTAIGFVTLGALFGPLLRRLYRMHDVQPGRQMFSTAMSSVAVNSPATTHATRDGQVLATINEDKEVRVVGSIIHRRKCVDASTNT